ncbi:bifunctional 2-polyprenyl-6-hydroxyphenol methylase/3-demethylubiquinol 3-O-methyltransferase UbiG [Actinomadura sp. BRA 177]|uniref:class I SAM-dependent methyltransferase n=1 Tax=Actinomadura sp. BRA 177 TaxID=2745202 RepID=UPI001595AE3C|nr:class I SAM-dependent methyltransferase [Actinomadura sp. BRA 177]NVI87555.1 methyltransferase domain-containing protein [Actinomadura sp. BRA 177]
MPTLSNEPHHQRHVAESFGADADRYDRTRPSYPNALVERLATPGPDVLDVGCGTGIAARQFRAAGCRVLGVEPDARMAGLARRTGIETEVAKIEDWDPAGRTFDTVIAGQAWHWVDPVAGAAKAAQALRPGGRLAVFWNAFLLPSGLGEAFAAVYRRVLPDSPIFHRPLPAADAYSMLCDKASDGMRQTKAFGAPEEWRFDWERHYTRDEWLEQVPTFGLHSQIPPDEQQEVLSGIGAAIDAAGGDFTMRYTTMVATASRNS